MSTAKRRVSTIGRWTIDVLEGFELIDNGDSWQASQDDRVVYLSSMAVQSPGGSKTDAGSLCAAAARRFNPDAERHRHSSENLKGEAQITQVADHWQLKGVMCVAGILATCVIDYSSESDREWAIATWKSLKHH